jgi:hypothetical protein
MKQLAGYFIVMMILAFVLPTESHSSFETNAPMITHHSRRVVLKRSGIPLSVHVADDSRIGRVLVVFRIDGHMIEKQIPKESSEVDVPVQVQVIKPNTPLFLTADTTRLIETLAEGDQLWVTGQKKSFFQVQSSEHRTGYIDPKATLVLRYGVKYSTVISDSILGDHSSLNYRLVVLDEYGNSTETPWHPLRVLTFDQVQALLQGKSLNPDNTPLYRHPLFLICTGLISAGLVYAVGMGAL